MVNVPENVREAWKIVEGYLKQKKKEDNLGCGFYISPYISDNQNLFVTAFKHTTCEKCNRKDKSFKCLKCGETIYIRRRDRRKAFCQKCLSELGEI